jgi:hypothetical protein
MRCMSSSHPSAGEPAGRVTRSIHMGKRSARLIALSDAAREQLRELEIPALEESESEPDPVKATDTDLSQQMARRHVLVVNSDPAFLDVVRVLLQSDRYNVTSTNLVPQTFAMVQAAGADALVVDLATDEPAQWELVGQLIADTQTRSLRWSSPPTTPRCWMRPRPARGRREVAFTCSSRLIRTCWVTSSTP